MILEKLVGVVCVEGQEIKTEFSAMIHQSGYFYARSEAQTGISQIQVHVQPFTSHMLMRHPIQPNQALIYELRGNNIGHLRFGSDNADGAWRTWGLNNVLINVIWFANGVNIQFEISTDQGAWTSAGVIDTATAGKLPPLNYWFKVFVPSNILPDFLRGEAEEWINPNDFISHFVSSLDKYELKTYPL